jgi:hypothetical protein
MTREALAASSDELVRSQWCDAFAPDFFALPERRLLLAVLIDALRLLRKGNLTEQKRVVMWIRGEEARFTFQDVCDGLELDSQRVAAQMVEENRATPVPGRRRPGRKGQSCGRRWRRGVGVPVLRDPRPAPMPEDSSPARSRVVASESPSVLGDVASGLLAAAM